MHRLLDRPFLGSSQFYSLLGSGHLNELLQVLLLSRERAFECQPVKEKQTFLRLSTQDRENLVYRFILFQSQGIDGSI